MFGYTAAVAYFIAKGQDVDLPDKYGATPLMHAAHQAKKYAKISIFKFNFIYLVVIHVNYLFGKK